MTGVGYRSNYLSKVNNHILYFSLHRFAKTQQERAKNASRNCASIADVARSISGLVKWMICGLKNFPFHFMPIFKVFQDILMRSEIIFFTLA